VSDRRRTRECHRRLLGLLAVAFLAGARDGTLRRRDGAALVAARLVLFGGQ
jgi:hypothetical protein